MKNILFFSFAAFSFYGKLFAQDIHWSQPANNLMFENPAFTGISHKFSFNMNYRDQWKAANAPYKSYNVAGDYQFKKDNAKKVFLSAGILFSNDVAGDGSYRTSNNGLLFSCQVKASDKIQFGAGINYNLVQSALSLDHFSWGSQFNGQAYDPSLLSGENTGAFSKWYSDINAGLSLKYDKNSSTTTSANDSKLIFGYSINHINRPDIALLGGSEKLNFRHTAFFTGLIGLNNRNIALEPTAYYHRQGKQNEIVAGTLLRFTVGQQSKITGYKKGVAFSFGALYRVNDAIIPTVQLEAGDLVLGISYDVNVSSLSNASRYKGGLELSLVFADLRSFVYKGNN